MSARIQDIIDGLWKEYRKQEQLLYDKHTDYSVKRRAKQRMQRYQQEAEKLEKEFPQRD